MPKTLLRVRESLRSLTECIAEISWSFDAETYEAQFICIHFPMRARSNPPRRSNRTRKKQRLTRLQRQRKRQKTR